jgi:hypothetical protein
LSRRRRSRSRSLGVAARLLERGNLSLLKSVKTNERDESMIV